MTAMTVSHYVHVLRKPKGAHLIARLSGGEVTVFLSPDYPPELVDEAVEWLGYFLEGLMTCSEYDWWSVEDGLPEDFERITGLNRDALLQGVLHAQRSAQAQEAARTGPLQGERAAGEPPAPAAD
jgi:hypothetical protein